MNPSFMAVCQMKPLDIMQTILGLHVPKGQKETSINGRAFAPGHGHQQETGPEKEIKVQEHLTQLRKDVAERNTYPTSDLIELLHEHIDEVRERAAKAAIHTGDGRFEAE